MKRKWSLSGLARDTKGIKRERKQICKKKKEGETFSFSDDNFGFGTTIFNYFERSSSSSLVACENFMSKPAQVSCANRLACSNSGNINNKDSHRLIPGSNSEFCPVVVNSKRWRQSKRVLDGDRDGDQV